MKRLCLVLPCNIYVVPYFNNYEKLLKELGIEYDLILWNRSGIEETCNGRIISFNCLDKVNDGNPFKVAKYFLFARFVEKQIKKEKYEKIIFLSTAAGIIALLQRYLEKHYQNKYWVDIRDYSHENNKVYKHYLGKGLNNAYCCDVSSRGYFEFLPEIRNYCVTHNVDFDTIEKYNPSEMISSEKIRISFIGNVRYFDQNVRILQRFKNDARFLIQYFGVGSDRLEQYCKDNDITNVLFEGRFDHAQTVNLYYRTDIINNVYGNSGVDLTTALSNKLYYSIYLDKPILVSPDTYMSRITEQYEIGYVVDLEDNFLADHVYDWYRSYKNTKKLQELKLKIEEDYNDYIRKLKEFILG